MGNLCVGRPKREALAPCTVSVHRGLADCCRSAFLPIFISRSLSLVVMQVLPHDVIALVLSYLPNTWRSALGLRGACRQHLEMFAAVVMDAQYESVVNSLLAGSMRHNDSILVLASQAYDGCLSALYWLDHLARGNYGPWGRLEAYLLSLAPVVVIPRSELTFKLSQLGLLNDREGSGAHLVGAPFPTPGEPALAKGGFVGFLSSFLPAKKKEPLKPLTEAELQEDDVRVSRIALAQLLERAYVVLSQNPLDSVSHDVTIQPPFIRRTAPSCTAVPKPNGAHALMIDASRKRVVSDQEMIEANDPASASEYRLQVKVPFDSSFVFSHPLEADSADCLCTNAKIFEAPIPPHRAWDGSLIGSLKRPTHGVITTLGGRPALPFHRARVSHLRDLVWISFQMSVNHIEITDMPALTQLANVLHSLKTIVLARNPKFESLSGFFSNSCETLEYVVLQDLPSFTRISKGFLHGCTALRQVSILNCPNIARIRQLPQYCENSSPGVPRST